MRYDDSGVVVVVGLVVAEIVAIGAIVVVVAGWVLEVVVVVGNIVANYWNRLVVVLAGLVAGVGWFQHFEWRWLWSRWKRRKLRGTGSIPASDYVQSIPS